ncbi:MAG: hypothetical protein WAU86_10200 [Oricola sp.]
MSHDQDNTNIPPSTRLVDAVRKARIAHADRSDVVVEMRDAVQARLELLAHDLQPVIDDVPLDDDRFDFALSSGLQPRFWIDATAHVQMGPDRRTYRFVRDTRLGRVLLAESADRAEVAERIVTYIATRIHERELAFAGETVSMRELKTGRAIDLDAEDAASSNTEQAGNRIERAISDLIGDDRNEPAKGVEEPSRMPERQSPPAQPAPSAEIPIRRQESHASAVLAGLLWFLLGAAISGGTLLLIFRDVLLQR